MLQSSERPVDIKGEALVWNGVANNMPIYRDMYFGAFTGSPIPGTTNPAPLILSCSPSCGGGATGSFDGFFTGRRTSVAGSNAFSGYVRRATTLGGSTRGFSAVVPASRNRRRAT